MMSQPSNRLYQKVMPFQASGLRSSHFKLDCHFINLAGSSSKIMTQYEFVRIDDIDQVGDIIKRWAANGWKVISSSTTFVHHEGSIGSRVRTGLGTGIYTFIVFGRD